MRDRSPGLFPSLLVPGLFASLALPLASLALPVTGPAQCPNTWQALPGCPGVNGFVYGLAAYDPDGAGPLPTHVVVAGSFQRAGLTATSGLVLWNPTTSTFQDLPVPPQLLGTYMFGPVAVRGTELLVVASDQATGTCRLASYDGTSWTTLGGAFQGYVYALHARGNGEVLVGGSFSSAGGTSLPGYAVWNGSSWAPDAGLSGSVWAIDELPNGDLLAAGLTNLGGVARRIGTTWSAVGSNAPSGVDTVLGLPSGEIVASNGYDGVHRFDGSQWSVVAPASWMYWDAPQRLLLTSTGTLLVGGFWRTLAGATTPVATVDVSTGQWAPVGLSDNADVFASVTAMLELPNGDLVVGGQFQKSGDHDVASVARFDGLGWHALADGPSIFCSTAVALDGDAFVVGGSFRSFGNLPTRGVAHWNGTAWGPLGTGVDGIVNDLARLPDGSVVVGGDFTTAGGVPARSLARWDGSTWSPFGGGAPIGTTAVHRLLPLANGDLLIGGQFQSIGGVPCTNLARWNGTAFVPIPGSLPLTSVHHLGELPNGDLVVAGTSRVYRQSAGSWVPFHSTIPGLTTDTIESLVVRRDGSVAIASYFTQITTFPRLHLFPTTGSYQTAALTGGVPIALHELPDGDLLITGNFSSIGGVAANGAARIGTQPVVLSAAPFAGTKVRRLVPLANGDLLAVGYIQSLDGVPAYGVARLEPGCRPSTADYGSGCPGSAGPNVLDATNLPWLGNTFTMRASGLPANSLALAMVGLQLQVVPLPLATPLGIPGCDLLTTIDLQSLHPTGTGVLDVDLGIPNAPFLIGLVLHAQVATLDAGLAGVPLGVTSTNALQLVIGDR